MQVKVNTIRAWVKRRKEAGKPQPNADEIWGRIRKNWPTLSDEQAEIIFQEAV